MSVETAAVLANGRLVNASLNAANLVPSTPLAVTPTKASSPSISVRAAAGVNSGAETLSTNARNFATKDLAEHAEKPSSRRSVAIAGELSYNHRSHAALDLHRVDSSAIVRKTVDIRK